MEEIVFPNKVRDLRRMRGYTMQELCDFLGLSLSLMSKMEKGFRRINPEQMELISEFLDCNMNDLYMNEKDENSEMMEIWKEAIERRKRHNEENGLRVLGAGLRFIRSQFDFTVAQFAKKAGMTSSVYHRIEASEREMYESELAGISRSLGMMPEDFIEEIYNLYKSGVLDKFSENYKAGRGKPHVSPSAKGVIALSKTVFGKNIYNYSSKKMVALLGEGTADGKLQIDKMADAMVFAPFHIKKRKKLYAIKSHPSVTKNILPEHAVYFINKDSRVDEGDLAIIFEKHFEEHEKHEAEVVNLKKEGRKLIAESHTNGKKYNVEDLENGRIHKIIFISLDAEEE